MPGLNKTAEKLLTALCHSGADVTLDRRVFFSRKYHRVMTKYIVKERDAETGRRTRLLETYKLGEVVKLLAKRYGEIRAVM